VRPATAVGASLSKSRNPEVADLDLAAAGDEHVGRLDITVHDVLGVGVLEGAAELLGDVTRLPRRQWTAALEPSGEALPLDELGDEVQALVGLPDVEDLDDARIAHAGQ
jgi:hypothetical protein